MINTSELGISTSNQNLHLLFCSEFKKKCDNDHSFEKIFANWN
jgi:hypothetical protein